MTICTQYIMNTLQQSTNFHSQNEFFLMKSVNLTFFRTISGKCTFSKKIKKVHHKWLKLRSMVILNLSLFQIFDVGAISGSSESPYKKVILSVEPSKARKRRASRIAAMKGRFNCQYTESLSVIASTGS